MERTKNTDEDGDDHPWDSGSRSYGFWNQVLDWVFYTPPLALLAHVVGVVERDADGIEVARWLWAGSFALLTPLLVLRIHGRRPRNDPWRAAACLAYGLLGIPLLFIPALQHGVAEVLLLPLVLVWGVATQINAARFEPPPEQPRVRAWVFAGAAVIYGAAVLPAIAATAFGVLLGVWDPPKLAWLSSLLIVVPSLPLAVLAIWATVRLAREAAQAWRAPSV